MQVLAATGVSTYKKAHAIVLAGRVKVNGKIVKQPTHLVDPLVDEIYIHGSLVKLRQKHKYMLINKHAGVTCSTLLDSLSRQGCGKSEHQGGDTDKVVMNSQKLLLASRLDAESCGLQLITTDPDWAERVTRSTEGKHGKNPASAIVRPSNARNELMPVCSAARVYCHCQQLSCHLADETHSAGV